MKLRIPKRPLHDPAIRMLIHYCERVDLSLPYLRTFCLIAGLLASLCRLGPVADYLFGAGLLLHGAIHFQFWWAKTIKQR